MVLVPRPDETPTSRSGPLQVVDYLQALANFIMEEQLKELVEFLSNPKPQVRAQATLLLAGLSADETVFPPLLKLGASSQLARLLGDVHCTIHAVKCLINFSSTDEMLEDMLHANVIDRCFTALNDKSDKYHHLYGMLLVNLTRTEEGGKLAMQAGTKLEGLNMIRALQKFCAAPIPFKVPEKEEDNSDTYQYIAHVISNISQLECGRNLLLNEQRGIIKQLLPFMLPPYCDTRRKGIFRTMRNLCLQPGNITYLLSDRVKLGLELLKPVVGTGSGIKLSEKADIDPSLVLLMTPNKKIEKSETNRRLIIETIYFCLKHKEHRAYFKRIGTYYILRELHKIEKKLRNQELDDLIENVVPFFILDEEEEAEAKKNQPLDPKDYKVETEVWRDAKEEDLEDDAPIPELTDDADLSEKTESIKIEEIIDGDDDEDDDDEPPELLDEAESKELLKAQDGDEDAGLFEAD